MSACKATDSEPGREPDTLTCGREWGHEPPHIDPDDGTEWRVMLGGVD